MQASDSASMKRIRERITQITNGLITGKLAEITSAYALDDPRFSAFEDHPPFLRLRGNGLRDLFKEVEEASEMKDRKSSIEVSIFGEVGVATGYEAWSMVKAGVRTKVKSRFTMVFIRRQGDWFVIHEHFTRID